MAQVLEVAQLYGWATVHFRGAWTSKGYRTPVQGSLGKGWPDLVLVHPRRGLLFRELKTDSGTLSADQEYVIGVLQAAGLDAAVWRPKDWDGLLTQLAGSYTTPPTPAI